jgi:LmbE family N-acetylglucosaminyl deacetylase
VTPTERGPGNEETTARINPQGGRFVDVTGLPDHSRITMDLEVPGRALAVGAHPDDIELGSGGTLAKWAAAGCKVHLLVLTDGGKGSWDPERDPASLVAARQNEQREAARRLGSDDVGFLGWPDGELRNGVREQWEVCRWIRSVRPDVVLGHDPWRRYRLHPDHRNAGFILTDALVAARDPLFFRDQDLPPHRPRALLLWEADEPNHVEDVAGHVGTKVRSLLAHRSQYETTFGIVSTTDTTGNTSINGTTDHSTAEAALESRVTEQLIAHGRVAGIELGESFHLVDEI